MLIDEIYRYPVKGLTPERLQTVSLSPGRALPWDRAFALAQGDSGFDPAAPAWLDKTNFLCLLRNPGAAAIRSRFDETTGLLRLQAPDGEAIEAAPLTGQGRAALGDFLVRWLGDGARGAPQFHYIDGHSFCDHRTQVVSLIGLASLGALEAAAGAPRHRLRFRANIYLDGLHPWEEFTWLGRELAIGGTRLRVTDRTNRCGATMVNPQTAERDANPVKEIASNFGHVDMGVFAEVLEGGPIGVGDEIRVLS